jgi:predicted heme/steroid binding protein
MGAFTVYYDPPISKHAQKQIRAVVTPSMWSDETHQYSLDQVLGMMDDFTKKDQKILNDLMKEHPKLGYLEL